MSSYHNSLSLSINGYLEIVDLESKGTSLRMTFSQIFKETKLWHHYNMPYNVWVTHVTNGLKPLHEIRPNLTFHDSPLKEGYILSNDFYASTLTICLRTPLSTLLSLCHLILFVACLNVNSFCNFGLRWKSCKVLCRIFLPLPILILYQSSLVITYKHGWKFQKIS